MLRGVFKTLFRKLIYVLAILVILAGAVLVTLQQLTPLLTEHKTEFERYASEILQAPVSINEVKLTWFRFQPALQFDDVRVLRPKTKQSLVKIKQIKILFSLLNSIWQHHFVPSGILLSGGNFSIERSKSGNLSVKELSSIKLKTASLEETTNFDEVMNWLMQLPHLFLHDLNLEMIGFNAEKYQISLHDLDFSNTNNSHQLTGNAVLIQKHPTTIQMSLTWQGREWDLSHLNGKANLRFSNLSFSQWLEKENIKDWQIKQGLASADVDLRMIDGKLMSVDTNLNIHKLKLYSKLNQSNYFFNRISGKFEWKQKNNHYLIAGDNIHIDMQDHVWPRTHFSIQLKPTLNTNMLESFNVGYINLKILRELALSSRDWLPDNVNEFLKNNEFSGEMSEVSGSFSGDDYQLENMQLTANVNHLSLLPALSYPRINNITGNLEFDGKKGKIKLNSHNVVFEDNKIFSNKIFLTALTGEIDFNYHEKKGWVFQTSSLSLNNDDLTVALAGTVNVKPNHSPFTDLKADFTLNQAKHISRYLPLRIFDNNLSQWLKSAFLSGKVTSGNAILRGNLAQFPFDNRQGEFVIKGKLNDVGFQFAPHWPMLSKINGVIGFLGRQIIINVDEAKTEGIPINHINANIPSIGGKTKPMLFVNAEPFDLNLSNGVSYINHSPLEKTFGNLFKTSKLEGSARLQLSLKIPLKEPALTTVDGKLNLQDANLEATASQLTLNHLTGDIQFNESTVNATNIHSTLFNHPFDFGLRTLISANKDNVIQAFFNTQLATTEIEKWLDLKVDDKVAGTTEVMGTFSFEKNGPMTLQLNSTLKGLSLNLPPFSKAANESVPFATTIIVGSDAPTKIRLQYDNEFRAALILKKENNKYALQAANINFGNNNPEWPSEPGLIIEGSFNELDWNKIKTSLGDTTNNTNHSLPLKKVDLVIQKLTLFNQALTNVDLRLQPEGNNWHVFIHSDQTVGRLLIPKNMNQDQILRAEFSKLLIVTPDETTNSSEAINVHSLPNLYFIVQNLMVNKIPLGQFVFKGVTETNGLRIQTLALQSSRLNLSAKGEWLAHNNQQLTKLSGYAKSNQVQTLLKSLGLHVDNFDVTKGDMQFNIKMDTPAYAPSIEGMQGHVSLNLGPGRIVDVGQQSGAKMDLARMLSVFSLQTLPRRLTLDFSDIFQKGYSFDSVKGDFNLQKGDVYTRNFHFDGPIARINISGRIGLKEKDYDLTLVVTPHVTATLPVAATLLTGNPLVGVGALVVNAVVGSKVSKATANAYHITGPWNHPVWTPEKR